VTRRRPLAEQSSSRAESDRGLANCFLLSIHIAFRGDPDHKTPASVLDGFSIPLNGWMHRFFSPERRQFPHLMFTADGRRDVATRSAIDYLDSQPCQQNLSMVRRHSALPSEASAAPSGRTVASSGCLPGVTTSRRTGGRRVYLQRDLASDRPQARASPGMAPLTSFPNQLSCGRPVVLRADQMMDRKALPSLIRGAPSGL
jgi:hypothetical protein